MKEWLGETGKLPWFSSSGRFLKILYPNWYILHPYFVFIRVFPCWSNIGGWEEGGGKRRGEKRRREISILGPEHSSFSLEYCSTSCSAAAKSLQLCPILCGPVDGSPPGCPVPGILQARTLEWVAMSFSNAWKWKVKVKSLSRVRLLVTPWSAAYQAPPSMGFSRQEYWSGVPLP